MSRAIAFLALALSAVMLSHAWAIATAAGL